MVENPYEGQLQQLRSGDLSEIIVEQAEFLIFREAWLKCEDRTAFVGEAGLNGRIIYRYQKNQG
ncbi:MULTISPECIES: hypothetical protein [Enterococcus]|uniref:hypothetical protein n=1 Tax=Enterococcus TaxID=1350 RepID=UPI00065E4BD7|nr:MULTISPECIES: hypothetical protein [Enterococcus]KAF1303865.1 hypothetical protein BAU16_03260 [Enterococcus sp. JM9B]